MSDKQVSKSMFGSEPWLAKVSRKDLRDHEDRDI